MSAGVLAQLVTGEPTWIAVEGTSMLPLLRSGDKVRVDPALPPTLGAIVLTMIEGRFVMHRVVRRTQDAWITRGDNRREADPPSDRRHLLGVATHVQTPRGVQITLRWPGPCVVLYLAARPPLFAAWRALSARR